MTNKQFLKVLTFADLNFRKGDETEQYEQTLNMNDIWGWGTAWCETIPDEELPEASRLFVAYGWCGLLYWMSERRDKMRSDFADINRFVDFVRMEESIRKEVPGSSARAYEKRSYTLPQQPPPDGG